MREENDIWRDYDAQTMDFVETWLDADAVKATGLEDGFRDFYEYWAHEDGFEPGKNYWCKVVYACDTPFAVLALSLYEERLLVMEMLVAPEYRGQGRGTELLRQLLNSHEILGFPVRKSEAVIFPDNVASQRAFEKAGFYCHHVHEAGTALYYAYDSDGNRD